MPASLSASPAPKDPGSPHRPTVSRTNSSTIKTKSRHGEAFAAAAAGNESALQCTFGLSAQAQPTPHPLQQLRLRPASWSDESLDDLSDDENWSSLAQPAESGKGKATTALNAPDPSIPPKRPVGSITGIFSREVHRWAATSMYPPPAHQYAAGPAGIAAAKAGRAEAGTDEQMSESDVAEWDSAPGGSSVHSVPPSEDEESVGELMDVDGDKEPASISTAPVTPLRRSRRIRTATKRPDDKPASGTEDIDISIEDQEVIEAQEVVELLTPHDETMKVESTASTPVKETSPPELLKAKENGVTTHDEVNNSNESDTSAALKEDAAPTTPQPHKTGGSATPQEESVPITRREDQQPPVVYVSTNTDIASHDVPAVMMFGRRSSPARAVPLDRFTRGSKGKIACTWNAPAGHRPCMRSFTRRADLDRHIATVHQMMNVACAKCGATFSRQDALTRHQRDSCAALFAH